MKKKFLLLKKPGDSGNMPLFYWRHAVSARDGRRGAGSKKASCRRRGGKNRNRGVWGRSMNPHGILSQREGGYGRFFLYVTGERSFGLKMNMGVA